MDYIMNLSKHPSPAANFQYTASYVTLTDPLAPIVPNTATAIAPKPHG